MTWAVSPGYRRGSPRTRLHGRPENGCLAERREHSAERCPTGTRMSGIRTAPAKVLTPSGRCVTPRTGTSLPASHPSRSHPAGGRGKPPAHAAYCPRPGRGGPPAGGRRPLEPAGTLARPGGAGPRAGRSRTTTGSRGRRLQATSSVLDLPDPLRAGRERTNPGPPRTASARRPPFSRAHGRTCPARTSLPSDARSRRTGWPR